MKKSLFLYLKGMAMGAVDVVPGFSGGTMALITGIYDRLLSAFSALPAALLLVLKGRIKQAWQVCDATFLLLVVLGVLSSIFSLARLITYLMHHQPISLWSFFFGLVLVSVYLVGREVRRWSLGRCCAFVGGLLFALWITQASALQLTATPAVLFVAGAIAISAMILPGISGSFMLVLMGLYPVVLGAVKSLDFSVLAFFSAGCVFGLLCFSKFLSWMLQVLRDVTLAFLAGVVLGSLGKVWPWKQTLTWQTNAQGESFPLLQQNLWPQTYQQVTNQAPQFLWALLLCILAVVMVLGVEWYARRNAAAPLEGA